MENKIIRNSFVISGAITGEIAFLLVFIEQPRIQNIFINYFLGILLTIFGISARTYAAFYLRKKGTITALNHVSHVISTRPYKLVRHPQYLTGILA
jgi:protein-S-isoprenylcysteine O-methyltransferase Ste14